MFSIEFVERWCIFIEKHQLTVRMGSECYRLLQQLSYRMGVSKAQIVRFALRHYYSVKGLYRK